MNLMKANIKEERQKDANLVLPIEVSLARLNQEVKVNSKRKKAKFDLNLNLLQIKNKRVLLLQIKNKGVLLLENNNNNKVVKTVLSEKIRKRKLLRTNLHN